MSRDVAGDLSQFRHHSMDDRSRDEAKSTGTRSRSRSKTRFRSRSSVSGSFINSVSDPGFLSRKHSDTKILSLYKLLMLELNISSSKKRETKPQLEADNHEAYEQIVNMAKVPIYLEKFMGLGLLICLNSFLTLFTLVPIRVVMIAFLAIKNCYRQRTVKWYNVRQDISLARRDILTIVIILLSVLILSLPAIDISKLYHDVRGQAQIKLYVMFGVLEVADKLCSSIGQNILGILYDVVSTQKTRQNYIKLGVFFPASILYLSIHGYILIYQTVSLNVAANSYSNALLTLLFSNQFSELRGSVFKKFEREGLFQLTMADLTERSQLSLMLAMIALRNVLQLNSINHGFIPNSWQTWNKWFGALFGPSIGVLGSEIVVDWLKHCYITKFNRIRPKIYSNFIYVLALDYLEVFKASSSELEYELSDYTLLTKRIGLPLLATAVCFLRMSFGDFITLFSVNTTSRFYSFLSSALLISVSFVALLIARLVLGIVLLKATTNIKLAHEASQTIIDESPFKTEQNPSSPLSKLVDISDPSPLARKSDDILLSPKSPEYDPIESNFLPGEPNTEVSTIDHRTRKLLYDAHEAIPPSPEEKRNIDFIKKHKGGYDEGLGEVSRYEMSSKRIW